MFIGKLPNCHTMSKSTPVKRRSKFLDLNIYSKTGDKSLDETLLQPYIHIAKHLNKGLIRMVAVAFNGWYEIPAEKVDAIEEIFRILYNSGFLYDDIEDKSTLRRGKPVAHSIYGAANTLAAANYLLMIALEKILDFVDAEIPKNRDETIRKVTELIAEGFRGQGMEIYWREKCTCPTEEEYRQMCQMKVGSFIKLAIVLMSAYSTVNVDLSKLIELMAFGSQIVNDYQNLTSEAIHKRKTFCDDITEGKFSFPIIHAINSHPGDHRIMEILRLGTTDYQLKRHCLDVIEECGSLEYTKNKMAEIRQELMQEMKKCGPNPQMDNFITFGLGKKE